MKGSTFEDNPLSSQVPFKTLPLREAEVKPGLVYPAQSRTPCECALLMSAHLFATLRSPKPTCVPGLHFRGPQRRRKNCESTPASVALEHSNDSVPGDLMPLTSVNTCTCVGVHARTHARMHTDKNNQILKIRHKLKSAPPWTLWILELLKMIANLGYCCSLCVA